LSDALAGRGRLFLIVGEPGIGKTRLCEELAGIARLQPVPVLWGRCWEGGGAPAFWPWIQVLRGLVRHERTERLAEHLGSGAAHMAALLPELRQRISGGAAEPQPSAIESEHARFPLFDAAMSFLQRSAGERPLLIVLDDLHAADHSSLLMLQFIAREIARAHILLVGTYRSVDLQRQSDRSRLLGDIARNGHRLPLGGWSENDVARFVEHAFGVSASAAAIAALRQTTEGNPFFVDEVVRVLLAEGRDRLLNDTPGDIVQIPHGVRDVTRERLRPLPPTCQHVLTAAAVIGREFDLLCLHRACGVAPECALEALGEAEAAGIVMRLPGARARYSFSHMLIRQTLYDDLPLTERLRLHQRVGETLETLAEVDPDAHLAELAHHFFHAAAAGCADKAVAYGVRAAERAAALLAYEEAGVRFTRALEVLPLKQPGDPHERLDLLLALGDVQSRAWQTAAAHATFRQAIDLARRTGAPQHLARAALGLGGTGLGLPRGGTVDVGLVAILDEALAGLAESDAALQARVLARLAVELYFSDAEERRIALSRDAVDIARGTGDVATLAYVVNARHFALWNSRDVDERLAIANEAIDLAEQAHDRNLAFQAHIWRLIDLIELGAGSDWERELEICERLAEALRQPRFLSVVATLRAMRSLWLGRFDEVDAIGQRILALAERAQDPSAAATVGLQRCLVRRARGDRAAMTAMTERAPHQFPSLPATRCVVAVIHMDLGHEAEARAEYEQLAAHGFADLVRVNGLDSLLPWLAELSRYLGDRRGAEILYERLQRFAGHIVSFGPRYCFGPASHALGQLAATLGQIDSAARHYEDALAFSLALGGRPAVAVTQVDYATLLLARNRAGDREYAHSLAETALATAQMLGMSRVAERARTLIAQAQSHEAQTQEMQTVDREVVGSRGSTRSSRGARVISLPTPRSRPTAPPEEAKTSPAPENGRPTAAIFRFEGEFWSVGEGASLIRLKDSKGLHYIAQLLRHPHKEIHAIDLVALDQPRAAPRAAAHLTDDLLSQPGVHAGDLGDVGALLDPQARRAYKKRLHGLREELEEATRFNDLGRMGSLRREIDFISGELASAVGLHGRSRSSSSHAERARINVTRAVKAVIQRIGARHAALGRYLATTIKTGTFCSYAPDPHHPISWSF